ncbi:MAG: indole-3-glycerol-phosphate synthase, partial [Dehalococcoidia bacterium]|nr:indole-3-glycerol-phosphate synthase [Dehalococcoidia bacterium]
MILDEIVRAKAEELTKRKQDIPPFEIESISLKKSLASESSKKDFASVLQGDRIKLIAEVKRASPSKGLICPDLDPVKLAQTYAKSGAAAISVLTEERYFQGNLEHLSAISKELEGQKIPLLRKDFIFDPYQVYESRAFGADALLLIVAILSDEQLA